MFTRFRLICIFLLLCIPLAQVYAAETITFSDASIPLTPGPNGIAFVRVTSTADDAILSVTSNCCAAVELHKSEMDGDVMRMRQLNTVPLTAGKPAVFQPGGLHIMLIDFHHPAKVGDQIALTFTFAHAPAKKQLFTVTAPRLHDRP